jgi:hypothetical protein
LFKGVSIIRRFAVGFILDPLLPSGLGPLSVLRGVILALALSCAATSAFAQGGPPYYTNDPGTPGNFNWEINLGYMPFLYTNQSVSHIPDVDINFGIGERIQLTYESAWLRVQNPSSPTKFGMNQSNPGVKWRFYDAGEDSLSISMFPQFFLNNPNNAVRRGITPPSDTFELPLEFSKKFGPIDVDYEIGYQFVHKGPDGWLTGLVLGHEFTPKFELDMELYSLGTFHPSDNQPTIDFGARYKLHRPVILSWPGAAWNPPAPANRTSSAISAFKSCYLPSPTNPTDPLPSSHFSSLVGADLQAGIMGFSCPLWHSCLCSWDSLLCVLCALRELWLKALS